MINLQYADVNTPSPSPAWRKLSDAERVTRVTQVVRAGGISDKIVITAAKEDGQIIVSFTEPMSPSKRGQFLLDLEASLKQTIDQGLAVWLEPLGDRNSLRNLRGIEVKS